jgi:hypothetical protein
MRKSIPQFGVIAFLCAISLAAHSTARAAEPATAPVRLGLHDRIVAGYMAGQFDELMADIVTNIKEVSLLPAAQKADVEYIRKAVGECRPAWWKVVKPGAVVRFRPIVWGQTLNATFDPDEKQPEIRMTSAGGGAANLILRWPAQDMDDPATVGELPFTKGENADKNLWNILGEAAGAANLSVRYQANLKEADMPVHMRYLDFRGRLASAYYTTPRARRLVIWEGISGWSHEYDKQPNRIARRTIGILFAEEVLAHPDIYTTVPRPQEPPADGAESKLVWELQEHIRSHDLSLAEDKAFREAVRAFATLNEVKVRATSKAMLPNGQAFSLDPDADKPLETLRDAWIKSQYVAKAKPEGKKPKP